MDKHIVKYEPKASLSPADKIGVGNVEAGGVYLLNDEQYENVKYDDDFRTLKRLPANAEPVDLSGIPDDTPQEAADPLGEPDPSLQPAAPDGPVPDPDTPAESGKE